MRLLRFLVGVVFNKCVCSVVVDTITALFLSFHSSCTKGFRRKKKSVACLTAKEQTKK